uniref:Uncharacterized protein n=1 Tax=Romanomermis culicivorax TaxID=13658 RepID=A0A915L7G5_ROMCU
MNIGKKKDAEEWKTDMGLKSVIVADVGNVREMQDLKAADQMRKNFWYRVKLVIKYAWLILVKSIMMQRCLINEAAILSWCPICYMTTELCPASGNLASGIRISMNLPARQVARSDGNSYFFQRRKGRMTIYS